MNSIIKIFGIPRSGTNLLQALVPLNFKISTCLKSHFNDYLGWKHAKPKDISNYKHIEEITKEKIIFLFSIREKESWKKAFLEKHRGSYELPWEWADKNDKFIFNTPHGPEIYDSIDIFYDSMIESYKNFSEKNSNLALIINYEDLLKDQIGVLQKIKDKFKLELAQESLIKINKKINCHGEITGEII